MPIRSGSAQNPEKHSAPRDVPLPRPPLAAWLARRQEILALGGGYCAGCGRDILALNARLAFLARTAPDEAAAFREAEGLPRNRADAFEVDHRVEVADGGTHELANLRVLCKACHDAKTGGFMRAIRRTHP